MILLRPEWWYVQPPQQEEQELPLAAGIGGLDDSGVYFRYTYTTQYRYTLFVDGANALPPPPPSVGPRVGSLMLVGMGR